MNNQKYYEDVTKEVLLSKNEINLIVSTFKDQVERYRTDIVKEEFSGEEDQEFLTTVINESETLIKKLEEINK